jgi:hypothetical protein
MTSDAPDIHLGEIETTVKTLESLLGKIWPVIYETNELYDLARFLKKNIEELEDLGRFPIDQHIMPIRMGTELRPAVAEISDECAVAFDDQFKGWLTPSDKGDRYTYTYYYDSKLPLPQIIDRYKQRLDERLRNLTKLIRPGLG